MNPDPDPDLVALSRSLRSEMAEYRAMLQDSIERTRQAVLASRLAREKRMAEGHWSARLTLPPSGQPDKTA